MIKILWESKCREIYMKKEKLKIKTRDIVLIGIMLAIMEVVKVSLSLIPGVELVSLLFIVYTLFFREKMVYVLPAFCLLEGVLYGFGIWWFAYLYIWAILVGVVYLFRRNQSAWFFSILSGIYGLLFGLMFVPVYYVTGGIGTALSWWIDGLRVDVIHGISNFILCLVLFKPLTHVLMKIKY